MEGIMDGEFDDRRMERGGCNEVFLEAISSRGIPC